MGIDQWMDTDGNEEETEEQKEKKQQEERENTIRAIAGNLQSRAMTNDRDMEASNGRIDADIEDLALEFALMTMDYKESDFTKLASE